MSYRRLYREWLDQQIEDYKDQLSRDELLTLADRALHDLFDSDAEQRTLTELLLCDAVNDIIIRQLRLPSYRQWLLVCRIDTGECPLLRTPRAGGLADG